MNIITKLSVMMFLQFFIWGSWYTSVSTYMAANGMAGDIYWVFSAGPLGAIIAPFFLGMIADRFFNTEKVLAVLFLICGVSLFILSQLPTTSVSVLNTFIFIHMLSFMPTLALSASLAFRHLQNTEKQFPLVRVWGTIGWICAGVLVSRLDYEKTVGQFFLGGTAGIVLSALCLFLPKTPAPLKGQKVDVGALFFRDAWVLMKSRSFFIFVIGSFLVCIPLAAYYAYLQNQMDIIGIDGVAATKTLGQGSEVVFMFLMPLIFRKLGIKFIVLIGIAAWILRYVLFAFGTSPQTVSLIYLGILLHGICYDFFFVAGQVYVDKVSPTKVRSQAQALIVFFTQGLGLYFGAIVSGRLIKAVFPDGFNASNLSNWANFWLPLAVIALVVLIAFSIFFKEEKIEESQNE